MRNVLIASDTAAQQAGTEILTTGGNAADAVIAAMLAGAVRASPASLLGSGVVFIAGTGMGAYMVDGRARAPGLGERRPTAPVHPPIEWYAAVPALLDAVLTTHNRFGSVPIGTISRAATSAVRDTKPDEKTQARLTVLETLPRAGARTLERLGVYHAIMVSAGKVAGGVVTRDDLKQVAIPVRPLVSRVAGEHEVLIAPPDPAVRFPPPPPPPVPVGAAVCADMHGVVACALWAVAPEAVALPTDVGVSLAALCNPPTKGVPRRRPGTQIPMPLPAAVIRHQGRAWAGVALAGEGDLERARDAYLHERLQTVGADYPAPEVNGVQGLVLWVVRELGDEVRGISEAVRR